MSDDHDLRSLTPSSQPQAGDSDRSDSGHSAISDTEHTIHQPIPVRPRLPSRKSSGPLVVPRDSSAVGPIDSHFGPDDVRAMSPRRTSEDIDRMGKEARDEMRR
jgi:short coiled-coil protein